MFNRTLKTNLETRWPLKSNLELRWPPSVCHVIWTVFGTRNARTFVRSEDSEPFVRRTSRMEKRAYERILTFGTAQSKTPSITHKNCSLANMQARRLIKYCIFSNGKACTLDFSRWVPQHNSRKILQEIAHECKIWFALLKFFWLGVVVLYAISNYIKPRLD